MNGFALGFLALNLAISPVLCANSATSLNTLSDYYQKSNMADTSVGDNDLMGILFSNVEDSIYTFWKNSSDNNLASFECSISNTVDKDSATGFYETYNTYETRNVGSVDTNVYVYLIENINYIDRVMFRSATSESEDLYTISKSFELDGDTILCKELETIQVTDKFVSYFNICSGKSEMLDLGGWFNTNEFFQEHYVAFNFDIDIDRIKYIDIQSAFDTYYGDTNVTCGANFDTIGFDYSKLGFSDFENSNFQTTKGEIGKKVFRISPEDLYYSKERTLFGLHASTYQYHFNTIIDCKNDNFSSDFEKIFDGESYNSLSSVIKNKDGSNKYRWFVRFNENKLGVEATKHWKGLIGDSTIVPVSYYSFNVNQESPFMKGKDTTIINVCYEKDGKQYTSVVIDTPSDATDEPNDPFVPSTDNDGLEWWQILLIILAAFLVLSVVGVFVKPVMNVVKGILSAFLWILKVAINILYFIFVWWWLALIKKTKGENTPKLWLW